MPKDEFDFDDPMELNGIALPADEDTTDAMTECFIEEFMRLGYDHQRLLALFRNRHYVGMNMVLQNRGEEYVKRRIHEVFAQWGRPFEWSDGGCSCGHPHPPGEAGTPSPKPAEQEIPLDAESLDPMGAPIPKLHF